MKQPDYLKKGDKVALVATARSIKKEELAHFMNVAGSWGLEVVVGDHLFDVVDQFAGSDVERCRDLQSAMDDETIKAIFCARGGYGTVRIIDQLNFDAFLNQPKWLIGYSDITVLHGHLANLGIESIHGTMPINFTQEESRGKAIETLRQALFGELLEYDVEQNKFNRLGEAEGELIGGNLSILHTLNNTASFPETLGKILFLEDLDEYLYHIDRMMMNLLRSEKLYGLSGLVVGGFTEMNDNNIPFGKDFYEIISEVVSAYDYPVCFDFPIGHIEDNRALIHGRKVQLKVTDEGSTLKFNK